MTTDRAAAHAQVVQWTGFLRNAMNRAMRISTRQTAKDVLNGTDEILEVLILVPLRAQSAGELSEALATLVAVSQSRERFAKAFARCGRKALLARNALANFIPRTDYSETAYSAVLELLEEMERLAEELRVQHQTAGNVTQLRAGPIDPMADACVMRVREWVEGLASAMGQVMKTDNIGYASNALGKLEPIAQSIAGVPYAARSESTLEGIEPLVETFRRGGKVRKAVERCAKAAGTSLTECRAMMSNRDLRNRDELNAAVLVLLSELERLIEVIGRQPAA